MITILIILFLHWVADFVMQSNKMAVGKSSNWEDLLNHTVLYSCVMTIFSIIYAVATESWGMLFFGPITLICHTATDYFTSRLNAKLWQKEKRWEFFVSIGFDQYLHYVQLLLSFYFLS
jgi:hypothetical protein